MNLGAMLRPAAILGAALALAGSDSAHAQRTETQGSVYYQPPILPIQFAIDTNGRLSVTASGVFVTPLGTFGVGGGISAVPGSRHNTCFIVRRRGRESVYCIGTNGKLRLTTIGTSVVDISGYPGRPNVYLIDVLKERGHFSVRFVPSPGTNELARIRMGIFDHFFLRRDGAIVLDQSRDTVFTRESIRRAALYETDTVFSSYFVIASNGPNGAYRYLRWPLGKQSSLEARWLLQAFASLAPGTTRYERPVERFGGIGGIKIALYADGSIFNGLNLFYGAHIAGLHLDPRAPNLVAVRIRRQFAVNEVAPLMTTLSISFASRDEAVRFVRTYRHHFGPR